MSGFSWNAANWSSILSWVEELWGEGKLKKERGGGRRREEEEGGVGGGRRGNEGEGKREGGRRKEGEEGEKEENKFRRKPLTYLLLIPVQLEDW